MKKIYLFGTALLSILSTAGAWAQEPTMTLTGNSLGETTILDFPIGAPEINNCPAVYCNLGTVEMGKTTSTSFTLEAANLTFEQYDEMYNNGITFTDPDADWQFPSLISLSGDPVDVYTDELLGNQNFPLTVEGGKGSIQTTITATYTPAKIGKDTVTILFSYMPISQVITDNPNPKYDAYQAVLFVANVVEEGTSTGIFENPIMEGVTFNGSEIINSQNQHVVVYNTTGQLVASSNKNINLSAYPAGVYVIKAVNGASMKIVK